MAVFEQLGRGDAAFAFSLSMHNAVASAIARAAPPTWPAGGQPGWPPAQPWLASR